MRNLLGIAAVALALAGTLTAASAVTYPNREPLPQAGSHSKPSGGGQERPYLAEWRGRRRHKPEVSRVLRPGRGGIRDRAAAPVRCPPVTTCAISHMREATGRLPSA
jgi:hypothetical protein